MMIMKVRGSWVVNNDLVYIGCNHPRTHGARNQKFPKSAFTASRFVPVQCQCPSGLVVNVLTLALSACVCQRV